jgi:hypothetical protein
MGKEIIILMKNTYVLPIFVGIVREKIFSSSNMTIDCFRTDDCKKNYLWSKQTNIKNDMIIDWFFPSLFDEVITRLLFLFNTAHFEYVQP